MRSQTDEVALEALIERALTGIDETAEGVAEPAAGYGDRYFYRGDPRDFDKEYAIDTRRFWHFLETTQPKELAKLKSHGDYKLKILQRLDRTIKKYGILKVLKKGLSIDNAHFTFMYDAPLPSSAAEVKKRFAQNEWSITRQVHYSTKNPAESIDMVLFLNGLPLMTFELKNPWTGQSARVQGQKQYKSRDHTESLLRFGRCIVHFTLDTDEVYMTTRLAGSKTHFLPFNKGDRGGAGNPSNPNGHKTAYMWEEILTKRSLADIIQHFVRLDGSDKDSLGKRTLYFPRYHQLDVVRKLVADVSEYGVGRSYLIQHSAGSGKSNSITWCAYRLIETYPIDNNAKGYRGVDRPLFESVIVVTDRRQLDAQIRKNIRQFSEVKNIVAPAHSSKELKESLEQGKKIIITPFRSFLSSSTGSTI